MEEIKKEKTKQKPVNKKKVLFILLAIVIAAMAIGGIVTAFMLNYNVSAPSNLRVIDDGNNVYIAVDMNDNYLKYRFVFTSGDSEIVIESDKNILSIKELQEQNIEIGQTYNITVTYIGENEGNNSEESDPITWTAYKYLNATEIVYNIEENLISWAAIEHADYYIVYVNGIDPVQTANTSLELQTISGGERSFYVVAVSNNENYRNSLASNQLNIQVVHAYTPLISVTFGAEEKIITATGYEYLKKLNVYLDETAYECNDFEVSFDNNIYTYKIDVSLFYQEGQRIGVSPVTLDEYNIYNGEVTYAEL